METGKYMNARIARDPPERYSIHQRGPHKVCGVVRGRFRRLRLVESGEPGWSWRSSPVEVEWPSTVL